MKPDRESVLVHALGTKVFPIENAPISLSNRTFTPTEDWLSKGSFGLPDAGGFVSDLGLLAKGGDDAMLGAAFVYGISASAKFDATLGSWPNSLSSVPFFHDGNIRGVRLDSSNARLSLFIFSGSARALSLFKLSLDGPTWKRVRTEFVTRPVHFIPSRFTVNARRSFAALDEYTSYGVTVQSPQDFYAATTQSRLTLTDNGFSFGAITGEEGMTNIRFQMRDPEPIRTVHPFSILPLTLFVVEDMDSHVIVLLGMDWPR